MPRIIVGTVSNPALGAMYEQMLREAGIPITAMRATGPSEFASTGPTELWLEDAALLENPETASILRSVLIEDAGMGTELPDGLPVVEWESPPTSAWPTFWFVASLVWTWILMAALFTLVGYLVHLAIQTFA